MVLETADNDFAEGSETQSLEDLHTQAALVRSAIDGGRSNTMVMLFDYLLACTAQGIAPKEVEIFHAVFARNGSAHSYQDSAVRTYIHRLRQKLDHFYIGRPGPRLVIPKGEYRFVLLDAQEQPTDDATEEVKPVEQKALGDRPFRPALLLAAVALMGMGALIFAGYNVLQRDERHNIIDTLITSRLWEPFRKDTRQIAVVVGDYYLIGKSADGRRVTHLLRDFSINSRSDLEQYLANHPEDGGRYTDVDLSYYPTSAGTSLASVAPILAELNQGKVAPFATIPASRLDADMLRRTNIVYLGLLSGLGPLRDPVFRGSGFSVGVSYEELIDRKSKKLYAASRSLLEGAQDRRIDYGYLARLPGPASNHILIAAGTRDPAASATAQLLQDPQQIDKLAHLVGDNQHFEALYEIKSIGSAIMRVTLITARPLYLPDIWGDTGPDQIFPDSLPPYGPLEGNQASISP